MTGGLLKGYQPYTPQWTDHGSSGARTTLTLPVPSTTNATLLFLGGVPQLAGSDYTISGTTLSLSSTLADGIEAVTCVLYDLGSVTTPAAGSVNFASLGFTGQEQGQILYRDSSSWAVLAPGTSGQVLQTGGSSANPSWTNVSSDFVKIQSTTCSGSGVEFDSSKFDNSTYSSYEFRFLSVRSSGNGDRMYVNTSTDGGSTFDTGYHHVFGEWNTNAGAALYKDAAESATHMQLGADSNTGNATNESMSGVFRLFNPGGTSHTHMNWHMSYDDDQAGEYFTNVVGSGKRPSAGDVDGIKFFFGNDYDSGTIIMYGIK